MQTVLWKQIGVHGRGGPIALHRSSGSTTSGWCGIGIGILVKAGCLCLAQVYDRVHAGVISPGPHGL